MAVNLNLSNLSPEEILQVNTVLARNAQLSNTDQKRTKWLKFSTFGSRRELQKLYGFEVRN